MYLLRFRPKNNDTAPPVAALFGPMGPSLTAYSPDSPRIADPSTYGPNEVRLSVDPDTGSSKAHIVRNGVVLQMELGTFE